ncbi:uncharacterized protein LOC107818459 [Nicotiana tabacum]|uniref:Uncharacterized protein LOC107818459 n=2 Tax=Nicotiana TaxID=4085 RepID=A0A1S4CFL7_TOBAC|nr:PREDICTED: uncharacterized protein LOC104214754 [Nicotiana sylvestris]XP_016499972.1 PREDICTED: uncharacterized protein LOC107818459 [Nicotiana tabacum]
MEPTTHSSSPRQIRVEMRTKQMHDVDAGGSATPGGKQLKRKGKERLWCICGCFCGVFSLGDLSIPSEDLSDIDQHRRRYGALIWDYATKKQEDGSISESEVIGRLARRKGAPALNEKTRVHRKTK